MRHARELEPPDWATAPIAVYTRHRRDLALTYLTAGVEGLLGYPPHAFVEDPELWASRLHPDDLEATRAQLFAVASGEGRTLEYRVTHADGSVRWIRDELRTVADADLLVGAWTDVTAAKIATPLGPGPSPGAPPRAAALGGQSGQTQRAAALEALSSGHPHEEGTSYFVHMAIRLAEIVGAEIAMVSTLRRDPEPRLRTLALVVDGTPQPPVDYDPSDAPCGAVAAGVTAVWPRDVLRTFPRHPQIQALAPEGYVAAPLFGARGDVLGVVAVMTRTPMLQPERVESVVRLFAVRLAVEVERRRAEERFVSVFDFAPDVLLIVDAGGHITLANRAVETVLGYSPETLIGRHVEDMVPEDLRGRHHILRDTYFEDARPVRMGAEGTRLTAIHRDGHAVPVEISLSPLRFDDELMVVASLRDVTARVRAEEERARLEAHLRRTEKMDALGRLARGVAHDFNNLLSALSGNLALMEEAAGAGEPLAEHLEAMTLATSRARELVHQIQAFASNTPTTVEPHRLSDVVREVARLLRPNLPGALSLELEAQEDEPLVLINVSQIHRVLMNLATNAARAIGERPGRIVMAVEAPQDNLRPPDRPGVGPRRWVQLRVEDTGRGMDPATLTRIFEPFFTTKAAEEGAGLGLSVVHGVVAEHGGEILVESTPGLGTRFLVLLPVAPSL
jgi:two-component system cell cycle sensor histidine kinase/response regulator CckA